MKTRDKQVARLHPSLYLIVCQEAEIEKIEKSEMLDEIVRLGLAARLAMSQRLSPEASANTAFGSQA